MALVTELDQVSMQRNHVHERAPCTYTVFKTDAGRTYLQIDTYGSKKRLIIGQKSQTIQFSPAAIRQLKELLATLE